jgi:hypothetical protein
VPHLFELGVAEDDVNDAGSVNGRVGINRSCNLLNARVNDFLLGFAASYD